MTTTSPKIPNSGNSPLLGRLASSLFDIRVIGVIAQVLFVFVTVAFFVWIGTNTAANVEQLGEAQFRCSDGSASFRCAFDFLSTDAQFDISESVIDYEPTDSYWRALGVGALNSLKVISLGIILTTILGVLVGIARLSSNWLVSNVAKWYVDLFRNTPLVLQLIFLFFVFFAFFLPDHTSAAQPFGLPIYLSKRGINFPWPNMMTGAPTFIAFLVLGILQAQLIWNMLGRRELQTGKETRRWPLVLGSFVLVAVLGWYFAGQGTSTHAIMAPVGSRIRQFDDIEQLAKQRYGVNNLTEIDELVASGELTEEAFEANQIVVCAIADSKAQVNFSEQLTSANIPFVVDTDSRADRATENYVEGGCEIYVASFTRLAAERDVLEDSAAHQIVTIDEPPIVVSYPRFQGLNFVGGGKITPAFGAVLIGLVLNTGASVAEIVRAGIQSVSKGQTEAARALGLNESQRLRLVVLPQALQVIIPPQTSQYLNLAKNSTLALAVSYFDFWNVASTIINQSGRALQVMLIVMVSYLALSLLISAFLNWYNSRITLKER